jgi:hypothetical protein
LRIIAFLGVDSEKEDESTELFCAIEDTSDKEYEHDASGTGLPILTGT